MKQFNGTKKQQTDKRGSAGPEGISITPPAYDIDFLDQGSAQPGNGISLNGGSTIQRKAGLSSAGDDVGARPENRTGLPGALKSGVESLSGLALDDVRVHYNSSKPAQLQALAYTQGSEIHVGPGQERHLPHEAWHVVQQKQGRVDATMQMKGVGINDDTGLEKEADVMGTKVLGYRAQHHSAPVQRLQNGSGANNTIQRVIDPNTLQELTTELQSRLKKAASEEKKGQVLEFEKYIDEKVSSAEITVSNQKNAHTLLDMVCALNQVSDYILSCLANHQDDREQILTTFLKAAGESLNTKRQCWAGGEHEDYIRDPESFRSLFSRPIRFLETRFKDMDEDTRLAMLTSIQGWDQDKGPAQLSADLDLVERGILVYQKNVAPPQMIERTTSRASFDRKFLSNRSLSFYDDENLPSKNDIVVDSQNVDDVYKIVSINKNEVLLKPHEATELSHSRSEADLKPQPKQQYRQGKKLCFITTACVQAKGLPDDCTELTTLRAFRDEYIASMSKGMKLIEVYYRNAPAIVEAIERRGDAPEIYDGLYTVIRRCVSDVQAKQYERAFQTYVDMVVQLRNRFTPMATIPAFFYESFKPGL